MTQTTVGLCTISKELENKVKSILTVRKTIDYNKGIIVTIDYDTRELVLKDEYPDGTTLEAIADTLSEISPCFIFYTHYWRSPHDVMRITYPTTCFFFTPTGSGAQERIMYSTTFQPLVKLMRINQSYEITNIDSINTEFLETKYR
ncbi:hypothetical protein SNEBB_010812 [Seison nebaliae]|nr:hypothetical protein SNEBB_010812 [Seison nebaliae]